MPHPLQTLLDRTPLPKAVKADAWDAFHAAGSPDELVPLLDRLPIAKSVKADLWDLKAQEKDGNMLPRETHLGRDGASLLKDDTTPTEKNDESHETEQGAVDENSTTKIRRRKFDDENSTTHGAVGAFLTEHFQHFNAGTLKRAAKAYHALLANRGQMFLSLAGAMSTAELGRSLAPMIRAEKISAMSVTGANLEEDLFLLVGRDAYRDVPDYHGHSPKDDERLGHQGLPRVTDVTIDEQAAMKPVQEAALRQWAAMESSGERLFPHELLYRMIRRRELTYQGDPQHSWLVAAAAAELPLFVPGWEDSTLGNVFAAECVLGHFQPTLMKTGIEYMMELVKWYRRTSQAHSMGFFQIGGGIAADFSICVVPLLIADLKKDDTPLWKFFCQITDADESYGGYSGALPTEKASWQKVGADSDLFCIKSDATICFPLIAALVMGW